MAHASSFWSWQLIVAISLNAFVSCILIGAYAARLAGAACGRVATAMSFYNLVTMVSRLAAFFYTPMLGVLSDRAAQSAVHGEMQFQWQLRAIVFASAIGAALGTLLLPGFAKLFERGIRSFERSGSLPMVAMKMFVPRVAVDVLGALRTPDASVLGGLHLRYISPHLLAFNALTSAVYAISMVGATYASVMDPGAARTALLSTGLVNAVAMASFTFVVDPASAYMTDLAVKGERSVDDVRRLIVLLSLSSIAGILLGQLLLLPASHAIAFAARLFTAR